MRNVAEGGERNCNGPDPEDGGAHTLRSIHFLPLLGAPAEHAGPLRRGLVELWCGSLERETQPPGPRSEASELPPGVPAVLCSSLAPGSRGHLGGRV